MAKIVLVTGGARSGKSHFAERALWDKEKVCYIATGLSQADDPEWQERIRLHQKRRPQSWVTHEQYAGLSQWLVTAGYQHYLLDCVTMLTTNLLFELIGQYFPEKIDLSDTHFLTKEEQSFLTKTIRAEWQAILSTLRKQDCDCYIVTNEVGLGIVPETRLGRYFRDLLGRINQDLAKEASEVYFLVSGLAQRFK